MNNLHLESNWWSISKEKILEILNVDPQYGLSNDQVKINRVRFGSNTLVKFEPNKITTLFLEGIKEPMMLLLLSISVISLLFGKVVEAIVMIFVVMAYIFVELINKFRADRTMRRLRALAAPTTKVIREGKIYDIKTKDIVVGDILIISQGSIVPADARLLTTFGLIVNEASLTGESLPVSKDSDATIAQDTLIAQRFNSVFSGTTVLNGEGTAIIVAVGQKSEFGKIAQEVQKAQKEKTILQEAMSKLTKVLAIFALLASALIPIIGFLRGFGFQEMVLTWLSLTFLMIPGQPPIIITMALALAAFALAKKQVIVKRLRGVEIIGQVTYIISDKTGTITESKMVVEKYILPDGKETKQLSPEIQEKILLALPDYINDPTDKAVVESLESIKKNFKQIGFAGFSDKRPWRDLIYKENGKILHAIAGNPEIIISNSLLSPKKIIELQELTKRMANLGKRVVAYGCLEDKQQQIDTLKNIQFIAVAVLSDPVRPGVKSAINKLETAGVSTLIVTGDHSATAKAIGEEVGMQSEVLTGRQIEKMENIELEQQFIRSKIFARMDPSQKLRLVQILQSQGEIVGVIGDGLNDAPALKTAQVGIAMGQIGTDLAKEVSDLILTDDNYIHIPEAVEIGRKALDNFKKGLSYYLSAKSILLAIFLIPLVLGIPFPFAPIQIILIELLMDLASSTIFVTEEAEPGIMKKPAEKIKNFLGLPLILEIIKNGVGLTFGILFIYLRTYNSYNVATAQTAAFVAWLLGHIMLALNLKQEKMPLIVRGLFSNYFGIFWFFAMLIFSLIITSVPFLYPYVQTTTLPIFLWIEILIVVFISTFWIEFRKLLIFKKH